MYAHAEAMFDTTEAGTRPYFAECVSEHARLRSLEGRHADAGARMSAALAMALRENSADRRDLGMLYLRCAAVRARAGDIDLAMDALGHASACGVSAADVTRFADVAALQTRQDFPAALRTPPAS